MRRVVMPTLAAAAVLVSGCCLFDGSCGEPKATGLTTDHLVSPANIGETPTFGWRMCSPKEGAAQKAYRLMEQERLIYAQPGRGNFVTPRVSEQRKKQQEAQMVRVEEAIRKAREMGIREEELQEVIRKIYER